MSCPPLCKLCSHHHFATDPCWQCPSDHVCRRDRPDAAPPKEPTCAHCGILVSGCECPVILSRYAPPSDAAPLAWRYKAGPKSGWILSWSDPNKWIEYTPHEIRPLVDAHPEDAPGITMTKSYLSGRQCCDFTVAEDDSETHESGCPWRIVDEFATDIEEAIQSTGRDTNIEWISDRVTVLVEEITCSPIRSPKPKPKDPRQTSFIAEDAPGGRWEVRQSLTSGSTWDVVKKVGCLGYELAFNGLEAEAIAVRDALNRLKGDKNGND